MDESIVIRSLLMDDMEAVVALLQNLSVYYPNPGVFTLVDSFEKFVSQSVVPLVAVHGDYLVGFGYLLMVRNLRGGHFGHIEDIVVKPTSRNSGIGTAIVKRLVEIAEEKGCYKVVLSCREELVPFYGRVGFKSEGSYLAAKLGGAPDSNGWSPSSHLQEL